MSSLTCDFCDLGSQSTIEAGRFSRNVFHLALFFSAETNSIAIDVLLDGNISELSASPVLYDAAVIELPASVPPPQPLFSMELASQHGNETWLTLFSYIAVANCILAVAVFVARCVTAALWQ